MRWGNRTAIWWAWYRAYLKSDKWKAFRARIVAKRVCCEKCKSKVRMQLHHLNYARVGRELPSDVQLLCFKCHKKEHPRKKFS